MTRLVTLTLIAVATFSTLPRFAFADDVPTYDVRHSCKADVQAFSSAQNVAACLADEQGARQTLVNQWTQFAADSRAKCAKLVGDVAGPQSYVELLTCLQMAKDVKTLPKN